MIVFQFVQSESDLYQLAVLFHASVHSSQASNMSAYGIHLTHICLYITEYVIIISIHSSHYHSNHICRECLNEISTRGEHALVADG
jgi:hypothetical protein